MSNGEKAIWEETSEEEKALRAGAAYMAGGTKWVLLRRLYDWYMSTPEDGYLTLEPEESVKQAFELAAKEGRIVSWGTSAHHGASIPLRVKTTRKVEVGRGSVFERDGTRVVLVRLNPSPSRLFTGGWGLLYPSGGIDSGLDPSLTSQLEFLKLMRYKLIEAKGGWG
jgi:hypothetical protein